MYNRIIIKGNKIGKVVYPLDNSYVVDKFNDENTEPLPANYRGEKPNKCIIVSLPYRERIGHNVHAVDPYKSDDFIDVLDTVDNAIYRVINIFTTQPKKYLEHFEHLQDLD